MASEATARRQAEAALTKLNQDSAIVEDAATQLVKSLTRLDAGVKASEPGKQIAARITDAMLHTALVMEKLCFEMISVLNEE